jgi:hypothetical protein
MPGEYREAARGTLATASVYGGDVSEPARGSFEVAPTPVGGSGGEVAGGGRRHSGPSRRGPRRGDTAGRPAPDWEASETIYDIRDGRLGVRINELGIDNYIGLLNR